MTLTSELPDPSQERFLMCSRKDGAGARLSNLLWSWRLARRADLTTVCFWPTFHPRYGVSAGFRDLFDAYALATGEIGKELRLIDGRPHDFIRGRIVDLDDVTEIRAADFATTAEAATARGSFAHVIESGVPFVEPGEDEEAAFEEVRALFARLPLNLAIRTSLKRVDKAHRLNTMVAVHVRRGDIITTLRGACRDYTPAESEPGSVLDRYTAHFLRCCPPTDAYLRLMREYRARGWKILFFSDSPDAVEPFLRRFSDEIVLANDLVPEGLNQIQQALFELVMMSRCKAIVGAKSLFSRVATMIGAPRFIDARRSARPEELVKAFTKAVRFPTLSPEVQGAVGEVFVRSVEKTGYPELWDGGEGGDADIARLLQEAA